MAKGKKGKKGLAVHAAAAAYRRFIKGMERQGKTRKQAQHAWKKAQRIKERALRSCAIDAARKMKKHLREAGIPVTVGGEFVKLGGAEERAARHSATHAPGGGFEAIAAHEAAEQARWHDRTSRRRHSKKGGKRSGKRSFGYRVKGKSKWVRYVSPRMKKAMRAISRSYKTGHETMVSLDKRSKKGKSKRKVAGLSRGHYHRFVHQKVKAGHSRKVAIRMWKAHKKAILKKAHRDPGRDRGWYERPNWETTHGRRPAPEHHLATERSWSPRGSRHKKYGKKGFSKKGLAHLRAAGHRRHGGKGRRRNG